MQIVQKVKETAAIASGFDGKDFSLTDKFEFLTKCQTEFNHIVPSSVLHEINTISKIDQVQGKGFYLK